MALVLKKAALSTEDYLAGEAEAEIKHEYVDGQIFAMAGASERHNWIAMNIAFHLRTIARGTPCGVFMSDMKLRITAVNAFYYPDVMLTCDKSDKDPIQKSAPASSPKFSARPHRRPIAEKKCWPTAKFPR